MSGDTYLTLREVATRIGKSEMTVRNYVSRGLFPVYRVEGERGVVANLREVDLALARGRRSGAVRSNYGTLGKKARVVDLRGGRSR